MNQQEIHSIALGRQADSGAFCLMDGEIRGTRVAHYTLKAGESLCLHACKYFVRILFVCEGAAAFATEKAKVQLEERDLYIADPLQAVEVSSAAGAGILELSRYLSEDEFDSLCSGTVSFPYTVAHDKASTYTEDCKSEKTISRMLIPARIIPKFAMGSVETRGDDLIAQHTHPMLEQFFFGLSDNDCDVLIDDMVFPFHQNTLLHIPLGSSHGVRSTGNQVVHYLWMDFLFDDEGLAYMDDAHKFRHGQGGTD